MDPLNQALAGRVEAVLDEALRDLARRLHREAAEAVPLAEELASLVGSGGKRLRPVLSVWGFVAGGGQEDRRILSAAAGLELLHAFALVQDDVMDQAMTRRGKPAVHLRMAGAAGAPEAARPEQGAAGISAALLVGDLALVAADELLLRSGFEPRLAMTAYDVYNRMRLDTIAGQFLDLQPIDTQESEDQRALRTATLKSGRYSVEGPLEIGATLAEAPDAVRRALAGYGRPLGRAFQVRDDVLDLFGDPATTGKDPAADLRRGRPTALVTAALRMAPGGGRQFLEARLGRPDLTDGEVEQVRAVVRASGALAETLALIEELLAESRVALLHADLPADARRGLSGLIEYLALREA